MSHFLTWSPQALDGLAKVVAEARAQRCQQLIACLCFSEGLLEIGGIPSPLAKMPSSASPAEPRRDKELGVQCPHARPCSEQPAGCSGAPAPMCGDAWGQVGTWTEKRGGLNPEVFQAKAGAEEGKLSYAPKTVWMRNFKSFLTNASLSGGKKDL